MTSVPSQVNYFSPSQPIPNGTSSLDIYVSPSNGSTFLASNNNSQIHLDLPSRAGYIDNSTVNISYKYTITSALPSRMRGTPVYTPFLRLESTLAGTTCENINEYGVVQNMLINSTWNVSEKYGNQSTYGWKIENDAGTVNLESMDSRFCVGSESGGFSAPLPCVLSRADKFIPFTAMGAGSRITLTLDTISNMFNAAQAAVAFDAATGTPASAATQLPLEFAISDVVLSYSMIEFPPEVSNQILGTGKILLKSQSFTTSTQNLATGSVGTNNFIYGMKNASVKSLFMSFGGTNSFNGKYDSFNPLGGGNIQWNVAGKNIPARPISDAICKSHILTHLRMACGSIFDKSVGSCINNSEFFKPAGSATTAYTPAKCYFGVNSEVVAGSYMLSGISTQDSVVNVALNISTPTAAQLSAMLIVAYDMIIEIDTNDRSVIVRK
jgi:hypothetical protein